MAPIATAVAKSMIVHCANVRRSPSRNPTSAVTYIKAALPATTPSCGP